MALSPDRWSASTGGEGKVGLELGLQSSGLSLLFEELCSEGEDLAVLELELRPQLASGDPVGLDEVLQLLELCGESRVHNRIGARVELVSKVGALEFRDAPELGNDCAVGRFYRLQIIGGLRNLKLGVGGVDGRNAGEEFG